jgi:hypothetical protein
MCLTTSSKIVKCTSFLFHNSHVEIIMRQANEVTHSLTNVALCLASFQRFSDIPTCIHNDSSLLVTGRNKKTSKTKAYVPIARIK